VLVMRRGWLMSGLVALALAWCSPLPRLAQHSFAAHMTMHMVIVAVAAPCLAFAVIGTRFDPVRQAPRWFAPIPASLVEFAVVWLWHAPALHHAARHTTAGLLVEQAAFLLSGLFVWLAACAGIARAGTGVVALLLTSMHMTLLGALLALTPRPLYHHSASAPGVTPLDDQQLGGAIMLLVGGIAYLAGGLWLTARMLGGAGFTQKENA
jgi:putative membrane protein